MKTGIFCRTESVAMTLKIMCTYAHYITLGSRSKMASNHRVTDLEKIPVQISKDKALMPLSVVGPLFISSLLFHLYRALLVCIVSVFFVLFTLAFTTGWTSSGSLPFTGCFILFSRFILVCFIICKNEKMLFVLVNRLAIS